MHHAVPRRPDVSTRRVWLLAVVAGCWLPDAVCLVAWEGMHGGWPQVTLCLFFARPVLMPPPFLRCRPPPRVCRVGMLLFFLLSMLVWCVLITAFPVTDAPPPLPLLV